MQPPEGRQRYDGVSCLPANPNARNRAEPVCILSRIIGRETPLPRPKIGTIFTIRRYIYIYIYTLSEFWFR